MMYHAKVRVINNQSTNDIFVKLSLVNKILEIQGLHIVFHKTKCIQIFKLSLHTGRPCWQAI